MGTEELHSGPSTIISSTDVWLMTNHHGTPTWSSSLQVHDHVHDSERHGVRTQRRCRRRREYCCWLWGWRRGFRSPRACRSSLRLRLRRRGRRWWGPGPFAAPGRGACPGRRARRFSSFVVGASTGWLVGEVPGLLLLRRLPAWADPLTVLPPQLLLPELRVRTRRVAHPLGLPAVANVLAQEGVPVPPLVHVDAAVPAPDVHLQYVVPKFLLWQVKTRRRKLRGAEDPRPLSPLERPRPRVLVAPVNVLCLIRRRPRWRISQAGTLRHLWHG